MPLTLPRCGPLVAGIALLGCAGPPPASTSPASPTSPTSQSYKQSILPFPVTDSAGQPLELAFLGGFNTPRPQLVDADGDGDLDLFLQEVTGSVAMFERVGEQHGLPRFVFRTSRYAGLDVGEWFRFADVDQDGDLDLLAEQPYSYIKYYRNDSQRGAHTFTLVADTLRDTEGRAMFSDRQNIPQLGDLDCNRRADLLIGRLDGTVARYEAEPRNGGNAPAFRLVANEFEGIRIIGQQGTPGQVVPGAFGPGPSMHGANTMALTDYDSDEDLDLFWGDFFEPGLLLIENSGSCHSPNFRNKPAQFPAGDPILSSGYNAPTFGQHGSAELELVLGVLGGAYNPLRTSADNLYYLRRSSAGRWTLRSRHLLPVLDLGSETIPAVGDLDGDGDLDLLLANKLDPADLKSSGVYRLENVGSTRRPVLQMRKPLELPARYHYAPALGDLDGDGGPDLILGQWGPRVAWYRLTRSGVVEVDTGMVTITRGSNTVPALGDLDADGDLDLMVGESSGWLNYYENTGNRTQPRFTLVSDEYAGLKTGRRSTPHLADLDRDGDLDLLVGSEMESLTLYQNRGTPAHPDFIRSSIPLPPLPALAAPSSGDFDGDGDLDLVIGTAGGGAIYIEERAQPLPLGPSPAR